MKCYVTRIAPKFLCLLFTSLVLILSCNKDEDELEYSLSVDEAAQDDSSDESEKLVSTKFTANEVESRNITFYPIEDAHLQSGKGYDQNIVRLEENRRISYLKFDLSQIDSMGGSLVSSNLKFTVESDGGDGTVKVFKGSSINWSEEALTDKTAPTSKEELGKSETEFEIGETKDVKLSTDLLKPSVFSLVLTHEDGNDFAFASKEHPDGNGPRLIVSYNVPVGNVSEDANSDSSTETKPKTQESTSSVNTTTSSIEGGGLKALGTPSVTTGKAPLKVTFQGSSSVAKTNIKKWNWNFADGNTSGNKNPVHTFEKAGIYDVNFEVINNDGDSATQIVKIVVTDGTSSSSEEENVDQSNNENGSSDSNNGFAATGTPSKSTGTAPLEVSFTGSSTKDKKDIVKWNWDFRDGSRSGNKNPVHNFTKAGTYNVSFQVIDRNGLSATQTIPIVVTNGGSTTTQENNNNNGGSTTPENNNNNGSSNDNGGLKATASSSATSGTVPLNITFGGNSSVNKTNISKWNWNFGDGNRSGNKNPKHTFRRAGTYSVSLTIIDKNGKSATDRITIQVSQGSSAGSGGSSGGSGSGSGSGGGNSGSSGSTGGSSNGGTSTPISKSNYPSNAVFASSFGYNSSDATKAFESALRSGSSYVVIDKQSSDWIIQPTRVFDLRNMTIVFEPGVVLRAKSGAFSSSNDILFELFRAKNVTIEGSGAEFKMNKSRYNSGEGRHALSIRQGEDITIRGLTLSDSGGDGIYINGGNSRNYSQNITIENVICNNNRRLGMGIISAQNVFVKNSQFLATNGTLPEAGVNLEPNNSDERLVNINFTNCKFSNNDNMGFFLSTGKLNSSSKPISVKVSNSEFNFNAKSPNGRRPKAGVTLSQGVTNNPVKGEILFDRILFNGGDHRIIFSNKSAKAFRAVFKDCVARNVTRQGNSPVIDLEALSTVSTLGGFVFDNFQIQYSSDAHFLQIRAPSAFTVKDIVGDFRINEPNDNPLKYVGSYNTSRNQNVSIEYDHVN